MSDCARDTLSNEDAITLREVASSTGVALLAVLAAAAGLLVLHGVDRAHATVSLDQFALSGNKRSARGLGGTGKETAHHDGGSTKRQTLDNVTNILDTAVGNARNAEPGGESAHGVDGSGLGAADGHDLLGDAGRATAHTNTETVDTSADKSSSLLTSRDVSANDVEVGELVLDPFDHFDLVHGVALGAIENSNVKTSFNKLGQTDLILGTGTNSGGAEELLAVGELGSEREVLVLGKIGARDHGNEVA